jgi:hypothetical protein
MLILFNIRGQKPNVTYNNCLFNRANFVSDYSQSAIFYFANTLFKREVRLLVSWSGTTYVQAQEASL